MNDCNNIGILPNYSDNCWLNAIIMCVIYSQYSRNLLINLSETWKSDNYNLNIIKDLLLAYYTNKKSIETYFKSLNPNDLISKISKKSKKILEFNILDFYKFLGVNYLDIAYIEDKVIMKKPLNIKTSPDVIVLFHKDLNNFTINYLRNYISLKRDNSNSAKNLILDTPPEGIITYENEITFMGKTYILSSCLANSDNLGYDNHAVAGIICNNSRYVYNGYNNNPNTPCALIKYDWDLKKNENYCMNPNECKIDNFKKISDLCFNFGSDNRTLIYINKDMIEVKNTSIQIEALEGSIKTSPNFANISNEISKIKEASDINLLYEAEKFLKSPIDIQKMKKKLNRDKLETFILKNTIKSPETQITQPEPVSEEIPEEEKKEEEKKEEEEKTGGAKITKKELIKKINNNLNKLTKDKLLDLYNKLKVK